MRLFEVHKKGKVFHQTQYDFLYHMTDCHGFAYTVKENSLRPFRQNYVSTTYDKTKNSVYGYDHSHFKFILTGKPLVEKYGGFFYDHRIKVQGEGYQSLDEREIGLDTRDISPFSSYCVGLVLLMPIISEKAIRNLLADNTEHTAFFDPKPKTASPRSIDALFVFIDEWKKPVMVGHTPKKITQQEMQFLRDLKDASDQGMNHAQALLKLSETYSIRDYSDKLLTSDTVRRRQSNKIIYTAYNKYYQGRRYRDVDVKKVRELFLWSCEVLELGDNAIRTMDFEITRRGLYHPVIAPVQWGIIIKELMDGDVDGALDAVDWIAKNSERNIEHYDNADPTDHFSKYANHYGTRF